MASGSTMAVEFFGKVVGDEHPDLLREAARQVLHELRGVSRRAIATHLAG